MRPRDKKWGDGLEKNLQAWDAEFRAEVRRQMEAEKQRIREVTEAVLVKKEQEAIDKEVERIRGLPTHATKQEYLERMHRRAMDRGDHRAMAEIKRMMKQEQMKQEVVASAPLRVGHNAPWE